MRSLSSVKLCLVLVRGLDCSEVELYAVPEGSVVFPKVPLLRIEGPIAGPHGGIGASKSCCIGGFDATSNVAAGRFFGIPLRGTHSHVFVSPYVAGNHHNQLETSTFVVMMSNF
ncbi:hypothetical protein GH714_029061 [Hevea brasiliensis]|uniref:nicotinate phosphoribosyltransferase n=1 Tax=Hevea brasiliensis TaxID=3981 RepID=A0A6A6N7R7_HEVBR|nr:hypothetical protein GH714_029061 [Hevea brasiliensis]